MNTKYGLQLYSVRDITGKDLGSAIRQVSALGYKFVEFAGFFGNSAEQVKAMLNTCGITVSGTHSPLDDLRPIKIMETLRYHKALGNPYYIIPGADLSTLEKIEDFANVVNFASPIFAAEGIRIAYHNHDREFKIMPWGSTIHSELEKRTTIDFQIDTYWAWKAGVDPIALLERLGSRVRCIHVKDGFEDGKGMALGEGNAPVAKVVEYARKKSLTMVVESETLTPTGLLEVERCINYLKTID